MLSSVAVFGKRIVKAIKLAEGQDVRAYKAYNMMSELGGYLRAAADEDWTTLLRQDNLEAADIRQIRGKLKSIMNTAALKAEQFLSSDEPSWQFLKQVRVLDPNQLLSLPLNLTLYDAIPGISATPSMTVQWNEYLRSVRDLHEDGTTDIFCFWKGMMERTPDLSKLAMEAISTPVNSVDAERSFSVYKNVVSDRRHNLSDRSTAMLVGLYYNTCNGPESITDDSDM